MSNFGVREVCNVVLKDMASGKPVLYLESLKVSTLETTAETVYQRGGRGNPRIIGWDGNKDVLFKMEDALISPSTLAVLAGDEVVEGTRRVHKKEVLTVSGGSVTVSETPIDGPTLNVFKTTDGSDIGDEVTTNTPVGNDIGLTGASDGDLVIVDYYYDTGATTKTITISADKFPSYYTLEAETLFRRESDAMDVPALFTMPKIKIKPNFTITMQNTSDPSSFSFECDAFKPANGSDIAVLEILE